MHGASVRSAKKGSRLASVPTPGSTRNSPFSLPRSRHHTAPGRQLRRRKGRRTPSVLRICAPAFSRRLRRRSPYSLPYRQSVPEARPIVFKSFSVQRSRMQRASSRLQTRGHRALAARHSLAAAAAQPALRQASCSACSTSCSTPSWPTVFRRAAGALLRGCSQERRTLRAAASSQLPEPASNSPGKPSAHLQPT